jgi:arylsulfatase A-like enzyme
MNAICIVVDGLHAGYLGCYGNSWIETPALDRLAMEGFVFDQALIDSPELTLLYRGFWQGLHPCAPEPLQKACGSLPALLKRAGIAAALLTDEPEVAAHPLAAAFEEIVKLPAAEPRTAGGSEQTHLAAVLSAAAEWLEQARPPFCLWLHAQGMQAAWDAPAALRERYAEEEAVQPPTFVEPPRIYLPAQYDPDRLLGIRWAYAAQVTVFDRCLEGFLEWWDAQPAANETLLILLGARGYPLGEHRRVGWAELPANETLLHEELIHVPFIVRVPDRTGAADRTPMLLQPADLAWSLADWFQLARDSLAPWGRSWLPVVRGELSSLRDRACLLASDHPEQAIRTPAWHLILPATSQEGDAATARKLYVKPDDRWEVNEVADRCGEVADLLAATYQEFVQASSRETPFEVAPLAELLVQALE